MKKIAMLAAATLLMTGTAHAQATRELPPGQVGAAGTLADFKAIAGDWAGPMGVAGFSKVRGDEIIGHLLLLNPDGKPRIQEIWLFKPYGASVSLRQKHFNADLSSRETKDEWSERKLIAKEPGRIYLSNMTLVTGHDTLQIVVRVTGPDGKPAPKATTFSFTRVK